jgi:hypothetical protein
VKKGEDALLELKKKIDEGGEEEKLVAPSDKNVDIAKNVVSTTTKFCKTVETMDEKDRTQAKETFAGMAA